MKAQHTKETQAEVVSRIREHAEANYDLDGWDIVVECWSDANIADVIGRKQFPAAVKWTKRILRAKRESGGYGSEEW